MSSRSGRTAAASGRSVLARRSTSTRFSRDGSRIAFESDRNGNFDIYAVDAERHGRLRLTSEPTDEHDPAWSPTADRIAYTVESGARGRSG